MFFIFNYQCVTKQKKTENVTVLGNLLKIMILTITSKGKKIEKNVMLNVIQVKKNLKLILQVFF